MAKQAGTVAMLSDYRFVLGVGAGWLREEIDAARLRTGSPWRTHGRDDRDHAPVLAWRRAAEFHGEFYDFGPTGMYPRRHEPIPIWVGGKSDAALASRPPATTAGSGMNYDLDEIDMLLAKLAEERRRAADEGVDAGWRADAVPVRDAGDPQRHAEP